MWWSKKQEVLRRGEADRKNDKAPATTQQAGARAESIAENYLRARGVQLLARNVRCRGGEVDLIGEHQGSIVFFEVRLRGNARFGGAGASINAAKQQRVVLAAQHWLSNAGASYANRPCRFDAILLDRLNEDSIEWLRAAFDAF